MGFCKNCGSKLEDGARFCENCGTPVDEVTPMGNAQPQYGAQNMNQSSAPYVAKQSKSLPKLDLAFFQVLGIKRIAAIVVGVIVVLTVLYIIFSKPTANLNNFITVEFEGYETAGQAIVTFDYEAFEEKYGEKIKIDKKKVKYSKDIAKALDNTGYDFDEINVLEKYCIDYRLNKTSGLSNGDVITLEWNCKEDKAEDIFNLKLKCKNKEYKVKDLEDAEVKDPFEELEVSFSGTSPRGTIDFINKSSEDVIRDLYFSCDTNGNLKNGDVITVKVNYYSDERALLTKGIKLAPTEKEYTVEGLNEYISTASALDDSALGSMRRQAEDALNARIATNWDKRAALSSMDFLGTYILSKKDARSSSDINRVILVYKVTAAVNSLPDDEGNLHENVTYYYCVQFKDIIKLTDGTISVDLSKYEVCRDSFEKRFDFGNRTRSIYFEGYEQLNSLFSKYVTQNVENYNYDSSVVGQ